MKNLFLILIFFPIFSLKADPSRTPGFSGICRLDIVNNKNRSDKERCKAITVCNETADDDVYEMLKKKYTPMCAKEFVEKAQIRSPELEKNPSLNDDSRKPKLNSDETKSNEVPPVVNGVTK